MAVKTMNIMAKLTVAEKQTAITWLEDVSISASKEAIRAQHVLRIVAVREDVIERQKNIIKSYMNTIVRQRNTIVSRSDAILVQRNIISGQRTVAKLQDDIIKCQDASITALMVDALHVAA